MQAFKCIMIWQCPWDFDGNADIDDVEMKLIGGRGCSGQLRGLVFGFIKMEFRKEQKSRKRDLL